METGLLIIITALFAVGFFCTILSSVVLLSSKDGRSPANRFLVFFLFAMSIASFMNFMIIGKFIVSVPWLYRLPSPMFYFLAPSAYLYVRMVLLDERQARKADWLHAVPALLHLIEMLPYYLSPKEAKLARIMEDIANPLGPVAHAEGWLPVYAHSFLWGCQGIIYAVLMILMLLKSRKKRPSGILLFPAMMQWLWVFSGMLMLLALTIVLTFLIPGMSIAIRSGFLYIIMAGTQIVAGLYLLLNPSILFGMPRLEKMVTTLHLNRNKILFSKAVTIIPSTAPNEEAVSTFSDGLDILKAESELIPVKVSESQPDTAEEETIEDKKILQEQYVNYIQLLTNLMEKEKPFLRKRYSINDLSKDVKIPQHHLSYILNSIFQIRFNEYINQFRIKYIKDRLEREDLSHLTLEALALEAGFNSRITFIRVVQKHTGLNPSEYFTSAMSDSKEIE